MATDDDVPATRGDLKAFGEAIGKLFPKTAPAPKKKEGEGEGEGEGNDDKTKTKTDWHGLSSTWFGKAPES